MPTVASCVGLVVHLTLAHDGTRRVAEIVAVTGRVENSVIETETVYVRTGGREKHRPAREAAGSGLPWEA